MVGDVVGACFWNLVLLALGVLEPSEGAGMSASVLISGIGKLLYEPASVVAPVGVHTASATASAPTKVDR